MRPLDHYFLIIRSEVDRRSFTIRLGIEEEVANKEHNYLYFSKDAQNQGRSPLVRMLKTNEGVH